MGLTRSPSRLSCSQCHKDEMPQLASRPFLIKALRLRTTYLLQSLNLYRYLFLPQPEPSMLSFEDRADIRVR
jgi:hypothetical protein